MKAQVKFCSCSAMMALLLGDIVAKTDKFCKQKLTTEKLWKHYHGNAFVSVIKPKMSIQAYLERLAKHLHISEASSSSLSFILID
jgi:hypothetical protein